MAGTKITGSTNISLLDSLIYVNVCDGKFLVNTTPSAFIGSGASNVLGAKIEIKNPYGVVIKTYGASYDIAPPMTGSYEFNIPTQAGKLQYGIYTISVQLTDADNKTYVVTKQVNVCNYTGDAYPCDRRVMIVADCKNGRFNFQLLEPPAFKGKYAISQVQSIRVDYPTASGREPEETTYRYFSLQLYQGVYKVTVSVCATYDMGDSVLLQLPYNVTVEKNVKCLIDYSCVWPAMKKLNDRLKECSTFKDKQEATLVILDALRLLKTAELANDAGEDASDYINDLERLLGCTCSCDCSGSAIVNGTPSTNVSIEGCLVSKETVGLTDIYTIDAKNYFLTVDDSQGVLGISGIADYGCTIYQQITFNAEAAYQLMKAQASTGNEYLFWASLANQALNSIDASCLGFSSIQWAALSFSEKINAIKNAACAGGATCTATITGVSSSQSGPNVILNFTNTGGFSTDIYVDGVLKATVAANITSYTLTGMADGSQHSYVVLAKCSNGSNGNSATGTFAYVACANISAPSITDTTISNATCPYDLTSLVYPAPPLGIEVEWHSANNTLSSSIVGDPTAVSSGSYYAFAKDANGCYSSGIKVTVACDSGSSCTAPQGLFVEPAVGGFKVSFLAAGFPPPSNSYTVKRKPAASPDVDGSYTTIGTPTYNSGTGRWEILDTTGSNNTLYTYKAQSNCPSSTPYVTYQYANITCPVLTLTPGSTTMGYSFPPVGGEVDKYEVYLYDQTGVNQLSMQTIVPAFSNPVTGTFAYLTEGTTYQVKVKVFIGSFSVTCGFVSEATGGGDAVQGTISNSTEAEIQGVTVEGVAVDYVSGTAFPIGIMQAGDYTTDQTGSTQDVAVNMTGVFTSIYFQDTLGVGQTKLYTGPGVYTFTNKKILPGGTDWLIQVN